MQGTDEQTSNRAFKAEDFDAYVPAKWTSNMYTLERRRVKNKLEIIGQFLHEEIESAGLALVRHLSDEFPSLWNKKRVERQWLFFSRDEAARKELTNIIDREKTLADTLSDPTPLYRHIFIGISVSDTFLEIGIRVHFDAWVDRRNLLNLASGDGGKESLRDALKALPDHFEIGLDGSDFDNIGALDITRVTETLARFEDERGWLFVGARLPRDQVMIIGEDISETAGAVFRSLLPLYKRIAWSPANDLISIDQVVAAHNEAIKQSREELDRERKEREDRLREKEIIGLAMREQIAERVEATQAWRSREIAAKRAAFLKSQNEAQESDARARAEAMAASWGLKKTETPAPTAASPKRDSGSPPKRPESTSKGEARPRLGKDFREKKVKPSAYQSAQATEGASSEAKIGAYVEVTRGFLTGRRGTIQEIDEKGGYKVAFGALSSRLEPSDVRIVDGASPSNAHHRRGGQKSAKPATRT